MATDADGDVEMTVPQPVFEVVQPPSLEAWDQASLVSWVRQRRQYEAKIRNRCAVTGEQYEHIVTSIRNSIEPRILDHLARFVLKKPSSAVNDEDLGLAITRRCSSLQNSHIPDMDQLFQDQLRMDLSIEDTEARILDYFVLFDKIVEDHGLAGILGSGREDEANYAERMKLRCKILLKNIAPEMLKLEMERLAIAKPVIKKDDIALYEALVERAREQQHYHMLAKELKTGDKTRTQTKVNHSSKKQFNTSKSRDQQRHQATLSKPAYTQSKKDSEKPRALPRDGCLVCKGPHWAKDCPTASEAEKDAALRRMNDRKNERLRAKTVRSMVSPGDRAAILNGVLEVPFRADTGADYDVITHSIVRELEKLDRTAVVEKLATPIEVEVADGRLVQCTDKCTVDVQLITAAGPVKIRRVQCVVIDGEADEFLLGDQTLKSLGINVDQLLEQLAAKVDPEEDVDDIAEDDIVGVTNPDDIVNCLDDMLKAAMENGFPAEFVEQLDKLVRQEVDLWRTKLGADPPAKLEPLRVVLVDDAVPYRTKPRQYSAAKTKFLSEYGKQLEEFKLVFRNNQSRWACAAIPVPKKGLGEEFRCANDYRPVNKRSIAIAGAMPNLLVVIAKVKGAYYFATFDLFKGFWQLMLHPDCQEFFSFITNDTVYTPTRVPQGATDSPIHFQNQMQEVFRDMLYDNVLIWVDDIVVFARTVEEFLAVLKKFFERLRQYGLKLNAKKSCLFAREISWCGRLIDGTGVRHDPERVDALCSLPLPATAADLQRLLCAANWLRESIVDFARHAAPLQEKLEAAFAGRSRKKRYAEGLSLTWSAPEQEQFQVFLQCVARSTKLSFPSEDAVVCVTTDASDRGWSLIVSQVEHWDDGKGLTDQAHELILCKGGSFKGAQLHWSIAEKEGYPIIKAAKDLEYLLHRTNGFKLFCDHANLIQIFCPHTEIRKHVRGKLQRWALMLSDYRYEIEHVKGEDNIWADIVSRWVHSVPPESSVKTVRTRASSAVSRLRPLRDDDFVWPTADHVMAAQQRFRRRAPSAAVQSSDGLILVEGRVWLPTEAKDLMQRVLVVAHCGLCAHRGADVMQRQIQQHFHVKSLGKLVQDFVAACLLCKHVKGGLIIQRPWSEHREPAARNEVLHFDYLFMGESYGTTCYLLVLKDELTHFCELIPCDSPTSSVAAAAVLDWAKRYGLPAMWTSDNGTHFKNTLMERLRERLKVLHTFVPVYTPWVNGTVERLNRDILQVMRVLLLEYQLDTKSWEYLLPLVQANLNQTPVASLGGKAPLELFTGLQVPTQLDTMLIPRSMQTKDKLMTIDLEVVEDELHELRESLQAMHAEVKDRKERTRLYQSMAKRGKLENFTVGDYVLWSRVDERLRGNKLMVRWVGPYRVTEAREFSFMIEHLLTGDTLEVHGSRLKFFDDASMEVNEEILEHVSKQGIVMAVEQIREHRYNNVAQQWELLVSWRGLQEVEDSWEPLSSLLQDVPILVKAYIENHGDDDLQAQLPDDA